MSRLQITVNTDKCQCYRRCIAVAPAVFAIGPNGKSEVIHPADAPDDTIVKAAKSCPYRAIRVVDESSGEQLFPPKRNPSDQ